MSILHQPLVKEARITDIGISQIKIDSVMKNAEHTC